jgi:hypothetical protein
MLNLKFYAVFQISFSKTKHTFENVSEILMTRNKRVKNVLKTR